MLIRDNRLIKRRTSVPRRIRARNKRLRLADPEPDVAVTDILAVSSEVARVVVRAQSGARPPFVEAKTSRWERRSALCAGADLEERRRAWQRVDPVARFRKSLVAWAVGNQASLDQIDRDAAAEARVRRSLAGQAPSPDAASVFEDVYAEAAAD